MKKLAILWVALFFVSMNAKSQSITRDTVVVIELIDSNQIVWATGISSDGFYVTGYVGFRANSFIWTDQNGLNQFDRGIGSSEATAISNNGIVVGQFPDSNYMYTNIDGYYVPLLSAGYYSNNSWHSLGMKPGIPVLDEFAGSHANAISADGTIIGGARLNANQPGGDLQAPTKWVHGIASELEYDSAGQGAVILALSADGTIAGGWAAPNFTRLAVVWVGNNIIYIEHNGARVEGEVAGISSNGKYAALNVGANAGVYDIERNILTIIEKKANALAAVATAVSNEGIVVGYNQMGLMLDREAFLYTDQLGMVPLHEYLHQLGAGFDESVVFTTPMGMSADGLRIAGFGEIGWDNVGWLVNVTHHLQAYNRPHNLILTENSFGNVMLTWDPVTADTNHTLTGYHVYRNNTLITPTAITDTFYHDQFQNNGTYTYYIKAVWNGNDESVASNSVSLSAGKVVLPFFEDFGSADFTTQYWNVGSMDWTISQGNGIPAPSAEYLIPNNAPYNTSLTSPFIDATTATELNLTFNIAIPVSANSSRDTMKVEIFDGTNWHMLRHYTPLRSGSFSFRYEEIDISPWSAGREIRLRFTAKGQDHTEWLNWVIDNIYVFAPEDSVMISVPVLFSAHHDGNGQVHLNWADPGEIVKLSFLEDLFSPEAIGNLGVPFIAANKFDADDLNKYENFRLTTISAYLLNLPGNIAPEFKLVVMQGGNRVVDQPVTDYTAGQWNTFHLTTPYTIDHTRDLYFGIEVVTHGGEDLPIGLCDGRLIGEWGNETNINDGRSNLYSEDGGRNWKKLTEDSLVRSLAITGILTKNDQSRPARQLMGYKVFRNGEKLLGSDENGDFLTSLNNYSDIDPLTVEACYEVSAYYSVQRESPKTEPVCLDGYVGIDEISPAESSFIVYPNPVNNQLYISGEFQEAVLFDLKGSVLRSFQDARLDMSFVPSGIYILQITSPSGEKVHKKIIKQ